MGERGTQAINKIENKMNFDKPYPKIAEIKINSAEKRSREFVATLMPFVELMLESNAKKSFSSCYEYVFQAACNYYEDEPQETKICVTHNFIHEAVNNYMRKFLLSKSKIYKGVEPNEKIQKIRKTNTFYGFVFTKPESINENTRFILGSVANRVLGYSEARGRIYTRHSDLFVYKCDKEDKKALFKTGRVSRIIGRVSLYINT
uniref:Deoxynucleotidyltransferase terminal-interacting protein 1 (Trinotate prediction) n=1 Tax=Myxobolus squamalis TaxID=59785 RepID=A0A6B2FYC3_MYXSQ